MRTPALRTAGCGPSSTAAFEHRERDARRSTSPVETLLSLSAAIGNQAVCRLLSSPRAVSRWAQTDEMVMEQIHGAEMIDAFRQYARETLTPTEGWPSRRAAIQQAIRDRLNVIARSDDAGRLIDLQAEIDADREIAGAGDWPSRVVQHYLRIREGDGGATADENIPERADAAIVAAAGAAVSAGTVSLAVYTAVPGVEKEFREAAQLFASDHRSLGTRDGRLVFGESAAMAATSAADVVNAANATISRLRLLLARRDARIDSLALFAHGVNARSPGGPSYLNLKAGHEIANQVRAEQSGGGGRLPADEFVSQVSDALGDRARVILYACELGDAVWGGESENRNVPGEQTHYATWTPAQQAEAREGALADELAAGDTSFADELRELLNATGASREVWGHRTTGHTTRNPTWRQYGGATTAGAENIFGDELAHPGLTAQDGRDLSRRNHARATAVVTEIVTALRASLNPSTLAQLEARGHGLRGWVARELPFSPTPFVSGEPPHVRPEVVRFLEAQAAQHAPPR